MSITIQGPKAMTVPSTMGGNDTVYGLILIAVTRGLYVVDVDSSTVKMENISDRSLVTIDIVKSLVTAGFEVFGYPAYFEVADLTAQVPAEFPNRTYTIPPPEDSPEGTEGTPAVHTWETYYQGPQPNSGPQTIDGKNYCPSFNSWDRGANLPASAWGSLTIHSVEHVSGLSNQPNI